MQPFPHHYTATASAHAEGDVILESGALPPLVTAPPAEFDGPGNRWSPETLLVAAVANCFVLTFRSMATFSKLKWTALSCQASGTLDRLERRTSFTAFAVRASLRVPEDVDEEQAQRVLARAEDACLITNSLKAPVHFEADVRHLGAAAA
jgi:organic hydroperoxide reductase OsmC/OhrA